MSRMVTLQEHRVRVNGIYAKKSTVLRRIDRGASTAKPPLYPSSGATKEKSA
jgi:hypothetical protein